MEALKTKISWLGLALLAAASACIAPDAGDAPEAADPQLSDTEQAAYSYYPMGFARIGAAGGVGASFNSAGGAVTATRSSAGTYAVIFNGLGGLITADALGGNIQVSAEGTSNARCKGTGWYGSPNLVATVRCSAPDGTDADSPFSFLFHRYAMPAPNAFPTTAAYTYVTAGGTLSPAYDYNSSGTHNTVAVVAPGIYAITIPNATAVNASMMVTPYGGVAGNTCSVSGWSAGLVTIDCRDRFDASAPSAFTFSYSVSGPTRDQQGGHAWFNGTVAHPTYSGALGKVSWCSPASITGSRTGSLTTITLSGDLGSWSADPFRRASFVSRFGTGGYCKVESITNVEGSPSTSTSRVRCYSPTGAVIAAPLFTFTQVTSDATGPC